MKGCKNVRETKIIANNIETIIFYTQTHKTTGYQNCVPETTIVHLKTLTL
jgi:hypothetical protein